MIKIKKFQNVYGIKELKNAELIDQNTIIYAPNGVMKTSFSDGIETIAEGGLPCDLFVDPPINAEYEIESNGVVKTENDPNMALDVFVFDNDDYDSVYKEEKISQIVMSKDLRKKYKDLLDKYDDEKKKITNIFSVNVLGKKKPDVKDIEIIGNVLGQNNIEDIITNLPNLDSYKDDFYKKIDYSLIFNDKTNEIFSNDEFTKKLDSYNTYVDKKMDEEIFNSNFTLNGLIDTRNALVDNSFFAAGHKILLKGQGEMDLDQLNHFIETTTEQIYETEEAKKLFDDATKLLTRNKQRTACVSYLRENKRCLTELQNLDGFKKNIIFNKLNSYKKEIDDAKKLMDEYKKEIANVFEEAKNYLSTWKKVINDYNSRFICNRFEIEITNVVESILGTGVPCFRRVIKGTNTDISDDIFKRFSSGEKRAVLILNLLFEIEIRRGQNFTLILDDIADSFDYKNKYGIVECLKDICECQNIQLIILTHNFDFYRSVRIALGRNLKSKLIASTHNNVVTLCNANQKWYEDYSYFNNWKNCNRDIDLIAVLPFLRNLSQLKANSNDPDYLKLTDYLHYNSDIENKKIDELDTIFDKNGVVHDGKSFCYLDKLEEITADIISSPTLTETDLEKKIILGMYIRIFVDRFMFKRIEARTCTPPSTNCVNESKVLFDGVKSYLNDTEQSLVKTALTIAPSFIHVNSFMYEPLVDVGVEKLKEVANSVSGLIA